MLSVSGVAHAVPASAVLVSVGGVHAVPASAVLVSVGVVHAVPASAVPVSGDGRPRSAVMLGIELLILGLR